MDAPVSPTDQDELAQEAPYAEEDEAQPGAVAGAVPAWLISFAAHATIGLVFSLMVVSRMPKDEDPQPGVLVQLPPPTEQKPPPKDAIRDIREIKAVPIDTVVEETLKPVEAVQLPPELAVDDQPPMKEGREEALSPSEHGGAGLFMAIGAGIGDGGAYGRRKDRGIHGCSFGTKPRICHINAVDASLRWFKKHQSANGMWDSVNYYQNCTEDGKCEKGASHEASDANVAATAFALRCFLGAGYDHVTPNTYRSVVEQGLAWLLAQQHDGLWGNRNYEHAIATMAVAEAYGMTQDGALRAPAQRGVDYLLRKQNRDGKGSGGLGWDYTEPTGRNDSSVTGWCVMALKSAAASHLEVKGGLDGARSWLSQTYDLANPNHAQIDPYSGVAEFGYSWKAGHWEGEQRGDRTSLGALCAVFLHHGEDPMARTLVNYAMKNQLPSEYPCNTYYLYYNTLAVFQLGGEAWKRWNDTACTMLVTSQRRDGCFDGSWDWEGTQFHGHELGRMFSTALCCLSLEVFYLYDRVAKPAAVH